MPPLVHALAVLSPVSVSPPEQLLTGELPPLPGQAQLGLQQSQNRVANPLVPLVGGTHAPELLELDEELLDELEPWEPDELELLEPWEPDELELLELWAPDELELDAPLELLELVTAPPLEELAVLDGPVLLPPAAEVALPLDVFPAGDPPPLLPLPPLPPGPSFDVLPALLHDTACASPTTKSTAQAARAAGARVRFLEL